MLGTLNIQPLVSNRQSCKSHPKCKLRIFIFFSSIGSNFMHIPLHGAIAGKESFC
uniref:Uncharacterized protein n=1 Tax=Rhizophora mucronata TaxID=61149 RepID=A0A2P2MLR3_RHIMU